MYELVHVRAGVGPMLELDVIELSFVRNDSEVSDMSCTCIVYVFLVSRFRLYQHTMGVKRQTKAKKQLRTLFDLTPYQPFEPVLNTL